MKNYRDDDINELIEKIEQGQDPKKRKVDQTWHGACSIALKPGQTAEDAINILNTPNNPRWTFKVVSSVTGRWAILDVTYRAKGANADDLERHKLKPKLGLTEEELRIRTKIVIPVGE